MEAFFFSPSPSWVSKGAVSHLSQLLFPPTLRVSALQAASPHPWRLHCRGRGDRRDRDIPSPTLPTHHPKDALPSAIPNPGTETTQSTPHFGSKRSLPVPTNTQPHQPLPPTPLRTPQPPGPLCPAEHPHSSPRTGTKPPPCVRAQADSSRNKTSERLAWFLGDVEQSPARWKPAGISPSCSPAGRFPAAGSARWCCAHAQRPQTRPRHPKNR